MKYTQREMQSLKEEVKQMWKLVILQLEKAKQCFINSDMQRRVRALRSKLRMVVLFTGGQWSSGSTSSPS